jgi:hypothetical protein
MARPTAAEIATATATLRTEAGVWIDQASAIAAMSSHADRLRLSRLEAGVFQIIVNAYEELVDVAVSRCKEGNQRMGEIASTLRSIADTYDAEERRGEHRLRNLY